MNTMATNDKNMVPYRAVHPAEIIKDEIKARAMTQKELAGRMGIQAPNLTRLLKGESISLITARRLESALDIPADFWMRLQAQYDRDVENINARNKAEAAACVTERSLSNTLNLAELYKRLGISNSRFIQDKLSALENALGFDPTQIDNPEFDKKLRYNYKRSDKSEVDEKNQTTWLTLAYIESKRNAPGRPFSQGNARLAACEISSLAHSGALNESEIKTILNNYGIAYSVVPKLERTPIDAASMNLGDYPAIISTHRFNDMSRLIFNVLHELGHIEKHMFAEPKEIYVSGDGYSSDTPCEREANDFAQNMLIDETLWNTMMKSGPLYDLRFGNIVERLRTLSEENHLDFHIVVWRWKYESQIYQLKGVRPAPIR